MKMLEYLKATTLNSELISELKENCMDEEKYISREVFSQFCYNLATCINNENGDKAIVFPDFETCKMKLETCRARCYPTKDDKKKTTDGRYEGGCTLPYYRAATRSCKCVLRSDESCDLLFSIDTVCTNTDQRYKDGTFNSSEGFQTAAWGPVFWSMIHSISLYYEPEHADIYSHWFISLGRILPCKACRDNFDARLENCRWQYSENNTTPHFIFGSNESFRHFCVQIHNSVNLRKPNPSSLQWRDESHIAPRVPHISQPPDPVR